MSRRPPSRSHTGGLAVYVTSHGFGHLNRTAAVLNLEGTIDDMMAMMHAHPTVWEAMGDAFASVRGLQINV